MTIHSSPFSDDRFEHDIRHLYYLPEDLYAILQRTKPCFLIGSRGTGKTTLLRSLSWRERATNEGLNRRLGQKPFKDFVGIYIKLPDIQLDGISIWLKGTPDILKRAIYSRYLELIQLQEIFQAVSELEAMGELKFNATVEQRAVRDLLDEFGNELYFSEATSTPPVSFADLSKSTRMLRRYIEKASQVGILPDQVLINIGSPAQLCHLSRSVAQRLATVISSPARPSEVFFKICFDEAETLDDFGVKILATWVRISTAPLYHVISFVSKPESLSETLLPNLTVQSADVTFLDLDSIKDKQFRVFAEGVTNLRLNEAARLSDSSSSFEMTSSFDTERLFGKLNINFLLEDALHDSVSPFAKNLLEKAKIKAGIAATIEDRARRGDDSALPIYETYLEMKTNRVLPDKGEPKWSKRRATSQITRKPMIAAYLSIMNELRTPPRYAYADMILQLSDSCIRDFLNNLEYIFKESNSSVSQFLSNSKIRPTIQNGGLLAASKAKFKSLPTRGVNHPSSTAKLVNGLGTLTQLLQTRSRDGIRHLKTTERGIYELITSSRTDGTRRATVLIVDAAEAGFLKIVESDELMIRFRVHTSLAPAFGFSYRGAYYPMKVQTSDVLAFADAADDQAIGRLANSLFERLDGTSADDLFTRAAS